MLNTESCAAENALMQAVVAAGDPEEQYRTVKPSARRMVQLAFELLLGMRRRGYSYEGITVHLQRCGIGLTVSTLKRYFLEERALRRDAPAAPAPPAAKAPGKSAARAKPDARALRPDGASSSIVSDQRREAASEAAPAPKAVKSVGAEQASRTAEPTSDRKPLGNSPRETTAAPIAARPQPAAKTATEDPAGSASPPGGKSFGERIEQFVGTGPPASRHAPRIGRKIPACEL